MAQENLWYQQGIQLLDEIHSTDIPSSLLPFWYLGQMGIALKWNGKVIYIDPVLGDMTDENGISRRNYPAPFHPYEAAADFVFCTHGHGDHMHIETLAGMLKNNPELLILVPRPLVSELAEAGIDREHIIGVCQGQHIDLGNDITVLPIAAAHDKYEMDEENCSLSLGYLFHMDTVCLFHSGDTMVTPQLIEELKEAGPVQIALLPVNGTDIERMNNHIIGNMDCRSAAYLASALKADLTVPLHYDMIEGNCENPLIFASYMEQYYPAAKYHIMRLGERFIYG